MFKFTCIQNLHCINDYKLTIKQQQQNGDVRELVYFRIYCSSTEKLKYFNTAWWYFLHYCIYIEREFIHLKISKGVCVCENKLVHFKISWGKFIKIITFISKSGGGWGWGGGVGLMKINTFISKSRRGRGDFIIYGENENTFILMLNNFVLYCI